jgi:hypothetical protein
MAACRSTRTGLDGAGMTANTYDEIFVLDNTILAQTNVTIPAGQLGGATDAWRTSRSRTVGFA